jgi:hypothetical protein
LLVDEMWLARPRAMEKMIGELEEGVREIATEILQQASAAQKRLNEMERQELAKLKGLVRNKLG